MRCPDCGTLDVKILETRKKDSQTVTRRRYECGNLHRFTTLEAPESTSSAYFTRPAVTRTSKRNAQIVQAISSGRHPSAVAVEVGLSLERTRNIYKQFNPTNRKEDHVS